MSQLKNFYDRYLSRLNKYWIVSILFVILTFTVGDSTLYDRYIYDQKIRELEKEIRQYEKEIEVSREKLGDLHADKDRLERYAREEFYMKKPDEDIFIIE